MLANKLKVIEITIKPHYDQYTYAAKFSITTEANHVECLKHFMRDDLNSYFDILFEEAKREIKKHFNVS